MCAATFSRHREKVIRGTNIVVQNAIADDKYGDAHQALLHTIAADDQNEVAWWNNTLRPANNLTHPAEAYLQGIKALRPAARFNTFDVKKVRLRRLVRQERERQRFLERRKKEVAPTVAMKASANPHKVPRAGMGSCDEDVRKLLSRSSGQKKGAREGDTKTAHHGKRRANKVQKIGKGL
ncbi:hypothetical protein ERJ75_001753000 [Trypanosoma vivax]|uniref:Uncharacterized protein n=1 Tax=Trypanosoma vivax (strain Y486) TaxID=1055687 RepID=G0U2F9_TRYVY|nr:hypothetical protein TRVL_03381 [Trypanosoma vivax]KAH8604254.1 hypothetical protein ERJ75_001753000 [Trypanosoma vivax]CCC50462.1 conserved hypothetical protein [Trypanosoma vivax Y486]